MEEPSFSLLPVLLLLLLLVLIAFLIFLGYQLARGRFSADRQELKIERQVLDAEWTALDNIRRVNDVFFQARQAMGKVERERHRRP